MHRPTAPLSLSAALAMLAAGPALPQEINPMVPTPARPAVSRPPPTATPAPRAVVRPPASTQPRAAVTPTPGPEAPRGPVSPAYERPMLELSEAIGSLAFLTSLCNPGTLPNPWERRMEGLVESEGEANANRERLMGAYNQGYQAFSTTYRQCTEAAQAARSLLLRDAARLARDLERRFGS